MREVTEYRGNSRCPPLGVAALGLPRRVTTKLSEFDLNLHDPADPSGLAVGSQIGLYVYDDAAKAHTGAAAIGGAAPAEDEVIGNVVLAGARKIEGRSNKFPTDIGRVERCARGEV